MTRPSDFEETFDRQIPLLERLLAVTPEMQQIIQGAHDGIVMAAFRTRRSRAH